MPVGNRFMIMHVPHFYNEEVGDCNVTYWQCSRHSSEEKFASCSSSPEKGIARQAISFVEERRALSDPMQLVGHTGCVLFFIHDGGAKVNDSVRLQYAG